MSADVIVEVQRGCVTGVYAKDPSVTVKVLDWDVIDEKMLSKEEQDDFRDLLNEKNEMEEVL